MADNTSITLVTAFFPIGRGAWSDSTRSDQKYLDYFAHWARMRNDLIVYTTPEIAPEVERIRQNLGRANTTVVTIDDYATIDPQLLALMRSMAGTYPPYSLFPDKPEVTNAEYDYVMALKYWCMQQAATTTHTEHLAWIDFGFDHGGTLYPAPESFDIQWEYPFEKDVTIFAVKRPDDAPVFDIVRRTDTFIQGDCLVAKTGYARHIYDDVREQYLHLLCCGMIDDDQIVLLMCARWNPEHYAILPSSWFSQLRDYTGEAPRTQAVPYGDDEKTISTRQRYQWARLCLKHGIRQLQRMLRTITLA
ncbi:WlaTC/HtrL family glycosyltransferase [Bifidobacterium eulemuris]|uniref:HtrL family protein n=1 Tax=Bifidobacterium eulemuris TaxID=1765219 RepID=A0A261FZ14_9BIFI|nr:WlaTC/HtrL family glycosyltransferase [Bifidobacterium eulemuris]OZG64368.1 hypothetical protein BEUL_2199 [Bifidobacterium eulemuris]QOL32431.1 hypothetical protein BE0216_08225 [Bifidobacterium eulemuris]